jgi:Mn-containing catalase
VSGSSSRFGGTALIADMRANVAAEAIGRTLATRLFEVTDDPGMKDMLRFLIARDTMHQQQWLAVLEELGPEMATNAPGDFENEGEHAGHAYEFLNHLAPRHWGRGASISVRSDDFSRFRSASGSGARNSRSALAMAVRARTSRRLPRPVMCSE